MRISPSATGPVAGSKFYFDLELEGDEEHSNIQGVAFIQGVYEEAFECDDPPCYRLYISIPPYGGGATLKIHARSAAGAEEIIRFRIGSPEPSGSPSAAA